MNPDEVLKKVLALAKAATEVRATPSPADATQLAELLLALDHHLAMGGKLPARWLPIPPIPSITPPSGGVP